MIRSTVKIRVSTSWNSISSRENRAIAASKILLKLALKHNNLKQNPDYLFAHAVFDLACGDERDAKDCLSEIFRKYPGYDPRKRGFDVDRDEDRGILWESKEVIRMSYKDHYATALEMSDKITGKLSRA